MAGFRFLHTADIHLDSPLRGLADHDGRIAERVRTAPRAAFEGLVEFAIDEAVDFMVIAGDLYDGAWRDYRTGLFFAGQMGRLNEADIPVFLLYGNHDAESQLTRRLALPGNVRVFGSRRPETFALDSFGVALHGRSFPNRAVTENLVPGYPPPTRGMFDIGVLHTALDGRPGHDPYAPCDKAELVAKGYDYWALGHVHGREVVHENPHIVFPGNLQGRHARETGAKSAYLVSVEDGEVVHLSAVSTDAVRWEVLDVDVAGAGTFEAAVERVRRSMAAAVAGAEGRMLACRIVLRGRCEAHRRLVADGENLLAEARATALGLGDEAAWVEKVVVETDAAAGPGERAAREDAVADLLAMLAGATGDAELLGSIREDIGELASRLPQEVREDLEDAALRAAVDGDHAALVRQIEPWLEARLLTGEG